MISRVDDISVGDSGPSSLRDPVLVHRPHGAEHPYATSPDQRWPVLPEVGDAVRLGVLAAPGVRDVRCEWLAVPDGEDSSSTVLELSPTTDGGADAAALAGGDGHLAAAQAAAAGGDGGWSVTTPPLQAATTYRYRFSAVDGAGTAVTTPWWEMGTVSWVEEPPEGARCELLLDDPGRLLSGSVQWLVGSAGVHRVRFSLRLQPDDHVVGFGERFDALDQRGRRLDAVVFEQYKSQAAHGRTYLPMPFAHVIGETGGWGFHVRTSRRTWFDVGASDPEALVVEVALGGSLHERVDVGVYTGTPAEVVQAFTDEVGRAHVLPDWVFRLWASGNEWNTQSLVLERMDAHRDLDIPVGVVVIEAWSDEEGITIFRDARYEPTADGSAHAAADFTYPVDGAWPDPAGMVRDLHDRGIKVVLWQIPLQKTRFDLGDDVPDDAQVLRDGAAMVEGGHAVLEADGRAYHNRGWWFPQALMPDLSTQRTRDWWTAKRAYLLSDLDVDGFKTDGGEHAWGHDLRYGDGRRGDEGNNLYPVHYARAFGDLLRQHGKAPVTFSRAGFTGAQAHGLHWAGDEDSTWEAFRASITAGLTASACGVVYWGWDLAGFSGPVPEPELYLRAVAASAFVPVMQYHSEFNHHQRPLRDRTPWHVAETHGDDGVVSVFRRYAHVREALVPYLAEQAAVTVATGRPLMRALFVDHPDDPDVWSYPHQWLLGDELLVSPVTEPGRSSWSTYLPAGEWIDVSTGATLAGGRVVKSEAPRDRIPLFVRARPAGEAVLRTLKEG